MKISRKISILLFLPFFITFLLFWFIPLVYGIILSTRKFSLAKGDGGFVGLDNFINIFKADTVYNQLFFMGMKNTFLFVFLSVIPLVLFGLLLALLVQNLPNKLKNTFRTIFFISYAVSVTAVSAIFLWLFAGNGGFINGLLISSGLLSKPIPWLEIQPFSWFTITLATVWWTIGFNMMMFINALNEIDSSLYEASSIDGANSIKQFFHIVLPNIKNVFFFVLMNTIIASFNMFGQANLMTKGGPAQSTQTLIMIISDVVFKKNNLGIGTAMSILMGLMVMCFSLMQFFLTREKDEFSRTKI